MAQVLAHYVFKFDTPALWHSYMHLGVDAAHLHTPAHSALHCMCIYLHYVFIVKLLFIYCCLTTVLLNNKKKNRNREYEQSENLTMQRKIKLLNLDTTYT